MKSEKRIGIEVKKLSNQFTRLVNDVESKIDKTLRLTSMQRMVIRYLWERREKKEIFQKNIEEEFNIRRSTASGILQLMEKNDLILREPLPNDARWKRLILTKKATKIVHNVGAEMEKIETKITQGISDEELKLFFSVIDRISQNIEP